MGRTVERSSHRPLVRLAFVLAGVLLWPALNAAIAASPPGTTNRAIPQEICGDGICSGFGECSTCPEDCIASRCSSSFCGDGFCQSPESCSSCSQDCGLCPVEEDRTVTVYVAGTFKRFWADYAGNTIWRSNPDGTQVEAVASVNGPYGISFDPATGSLIWTSSTDETVVAAPADGSGGATILQSSFEENFAVARQEGDRQVAYAVFGSEVVKITQDPNTAEEQREVLFTLSSPDSVHGLALTPDGGALYLGDTVGRMSDKLVLSNRSLQRLTFDDGSTAYLEAAQ